MVHNVATHLYICNCMHVRGVPNVLVIYRSTLIKCPGYLPGCMSVWGTHCSLLVYLLVGLTRLKITEKTEKDT